LHNGFVVTYAGNLILVENLVPVLVSVRFGDATGLRSHMSRLRTASSWCDGAKCA